jgi:hypothetical protein
MKKEAHKQHADHSDEFKEILTRPPHSLVQYGTGIISTVLVLLILSSFLFRYPDTVTGSMTIHYTENGNYKALVKVSAEQAGKIKPGMMVNIRLDEYPQQEYGILRGLTLDAQSRISDDFYLINIEIPENRLSTRQKVLILEPEMTGNADIIIKNIAIIDRIFEPIKNIFAKK